MNITQDKHTHPAVNKTCHVFVPVEREKYKDYSGEEFPTTSYEWVMSNSMFSFVFVDVSVVLTNSEAGVIAWSPAVGGVIKVTGRTIWLYDWHSLMIMGSNSTILWSANHTGPAWTALSVAEPWLEYWAAASRHSPCGGFRPMIMAVTRWHLHCCH